MRRLRRPVLFIFLFGVTAACMQSQGEPSSVEPNVISPLHSFDLPSSSIPTDDRAEPEQENEELEDDFTEDPIETSFIGGACETDEQCKPGLECGKPEEGFQAGHCTQACDLYCPDLDGYPTTFCPDLGDAIGRCFSRCSPNQGSCRTGYSCVPMPRLNEPTRVEHSCIPSEWLEDSTLCNDSRGLVQSLDCFIAKASFGDADLATLISALLSGDATADDAELYLDRSFELSQVYLEELLGRPPYPNRSSGHRQDAPMHGIVVHYTANQFEEPTIRYFSSEDPHASTHFIIGALDNGLIIQLFSHRDRTWHAGSLYNSTHFGIDFANAGYLQSEGSSWVDYLNRDYRSILPTFGANPIEIIDGIPGADPKYASFSHWQPYTTHQLLAFVTVTRALHLVYGLEPEEVVRHGDVSSSRVDPGPAFPHSILKDLIFDAVDVLDPEHWLQDYRWDNAWLINHPQAR